MAGSSILLTLDSPARCCVSTVRQPHVMKKTTIILAFVVMALIISSPSYGRWAMTYGGSEGDYARSVQQTTDGGYIVGKEA